MKKLLSIFKKKRKVEVQAPELYEGLLSLRYEKAALEHQLGVTLKTSSYSNSLYYEGEGKLEEHFKFVFIGTETVKYYEAIKSRVEEKNLFLITDKNRSENYNIKNKFSLNLPETVEELTFNAGEKWYNENNEELEKSIEKFIEKGKLVVIFVENYGYYLTIAKRLANYIQNQGLKTLTILELVKDTDRLEKTFYLYSYIYLLSKEDLSLPYVLIDFDLVVNETSETKIKEKIRDKIANSIVDLFSMTVSSPTFYKYDLNNFLNILEDAKGPCALVSCDVYENNPFIGELIKCQSIYSFSYDQSPIRGFIGIQPGKEGIVTKSYKKIRSHFANKDVLISIYSKREQGAVIRGLLTYIAHPTKLLKDMEKYYSTILLLAIDNDGNITRQQTISEEIIEQLSEIPKLRIEILVKEEEKK